MQEFSLRACFFPLQPAIPALADRLKKTPIRITEGKKVVYLLVSRNFSVANSKIFVANGKKSEALRIKLVGYVNFKSCFCYIPKGNRVFGVRINILMSLKKLNYAIGNNNFNVF